VVWNAGSRTRVEVYVVRLIDHDCRCKQSYHQMVVVFGTRTWSSVHVATPKCHLPLESEVNKAGQVDDANDLAEQKKR
jgi:hypothetical protein